LTRFFPSFFFLEFELLPSNVWDRTSEEAPTNSLFLFLSALFPSDGASSRIHVLKEEMRECVLRRYGFFFLTLFTYFPLLPPPLGGSVERFSGFFPSRGEKWKLTDSLFPCLSLANFPISFSQGLSPPGEKELMQYPPS